MRKKIIYKYVYETYKILQILQGCQVTKSFGMYIFNDIMVEFSEKNNKQCILSAKIREKIQCLWKILIPWHAVIQCHWKLSVKWTLIQIKQVCISMSRTIHLLVHIPILKEFWSGLKRLIFNFWKLGCLLMYGFASYSFSMNIPCLFLIKATNQL